MINAESSNGRKLVKVWMIVPNQVHPIDLACRLRLRHRGCWQDVVHAGGLHAAVVPRLPGHRTPRASCRTLQALPPQWTIESRSRGEIAAPDD
jgi:hypothetical protein